MARVSGGDRAAGRWGSGLDFDARALTFTCARFLCTDPLLDVKPNKNIQISCGDIVAIKTSGDKWLTMGRQDKLPKAGPSANSIPTDAELFELTCINKRFGEALPLGDSIALESMRASKWLNDDGKKLTMVTHYTRRNLDTWFDMLNPGNLDDRDVVYNGMKLALRTAGTYDNVVNVVDGAELGHESVKFDENRRSIGNKNILLGLYKAVHDHDVKAWSTRSEISAHSTCWAGIASGYSREGSRGQSLSTIIVKYLPGQSLHRQCETAIGRGWHPCGTARSIQADGDCDAKTAEVAGYFQDKRAGVPSDKKPSPAVAFTTVNDFHDNVDKWRNCGEHTVAICCSPYCNRWGA